MKKNLLCRAAMAGTVLLLSVTAVFPSLASEAGPGFEEALTDSYDGPESPLDAAPETKNPRTEAGEEAGQGKDQNVPEKSDPAKGPGNLEQTQLRERSDSTKAADNTETPAGKTAVPGQSYGTFKISAYCGCETCSGGHMQTYAGTVPRKDHTISADLDQFPLGTRLWIDGIVYTVEDKGSGVAGNHLDIYFETHEEALDYGLRNAEVFEVSDKED